MTRLAATTFGRWLSVQPVPDGPPFRPGFDPVCTLIGTPDAAPTMVATSQSPSRLRTALELFSTRARYLWLSLRTPAKIAGGVWLGAGLLYGAIKTRGFRTG